MIKKIKLLLAAAICVTAAGFITGNTGYAEETGTEEEVILETVKTSDGEIIEIDVLKEDPEAQEHLRDEALEQEGESQTIPTTKATTYNKDVKAYGIDVSQWQNGRTIDWNAVKASGVEFVIVRVGYRGNSSGKIIEDPYAAMNLAGAQAAGLKLGAYFFSTAINEAEAIEEAQWTMNFISKYDITYPIAYDCEGYDNPAYRTYYISYTQRQNNATAFLDHVRAGGYTPMMYASKSSFDNDRNWQASVFETKYDMWAAQYPYRVGTSQYEYFSQLGSKVSTYTKNHRFWQFSSEGKINGIYGNVDLDVEYYPVNGSNDIVISPAIQNFVQRLYTVVLDRDPDSVGLQEWTNALAQGKESGASVAQKFFDSNEYKAKNTSNNVYVETLYKTFLDRSYDEPGKNSWLNYLDMGLSRTYVLKGFAESDEFTGICNSYGITRGSITLTEARDQNEKVTEFVNRCYRIYLEREPDVTGLNNWTALILQDVNNAKAVPYGFVFSEEMEGKNLSNEAFITYLYRGLFNREPDSTGMNGWLQYMNSGQDREAVYVGFIFANEFNELLGKFQL